MGLRVAAPTATLWVLELNPPTTSLEGAGICWCSGRLYKVASRQDKAPEFQSSVSIDMLYRLLSMWPYPSVGPGVARGSPIGGINPALVTLICFRETPWWPVPA